MGTIQPAQLNWLSNIGSQYLTLILSIFEIAPKILLLDNILLVTKMLLIIVQS